MFVGSSPGAAGDAPAGPVGLDPVVQPVKTAALQKQMIGRPAHLDDRDDGIARQCTARVAGSAPGGRRRGGICAGEGGDYPGDGAAGSSFA